MPKIVTVRERVHQPFFDTLIRTAGLTQGQLNDNTDLFTNNGARSEGTTNLLNGSTLPSDQSHVTLALRVFTWFRNPIVRIPGGASGEISHNGDIGPQLSAFTVAGGPANPGLGNAPGSIQDVYRLHWQTEDQLHWSFGTGQKNSMDNMPTWYFPTGGGLSGDLGGATDLILLQNTGFDGHQSILKLARAILLPPRQNLICKARIFALDDLGQSQVFFTRQGSRNMLSLRDNLNAVDALQKIITFTFDGLFSRDVQ
jgi:hypothetical protein